MPNFFADKMYVCPKCNNNTFKEETTFLLKEERDALVKDSLPTNIVCAACGTVVTKKVK